VVAAFVEFGIADQHDDACRISLRPQA